MPLFAILTVPRPTRNLFQPLVSCWSECGFCLFWTGLPYLFSTAVLLTTHRPTVWLTSVPSSGFGNQSGSPVSGACVEAGYHDREHRMIKKYISCVSARVFPEMFTSEGKAHSEYKIYSPSISFSEKSGSPREDSQTGQKKIQVNAPGSDFWIIWKIIVYITQVLYEILKNKKYMRTRIGNSLGRTDTVTVLFLPTDIIGFSQLDTMASILEYIFIESGVLLVSSACGHACSGFCVLMGEAPHSVLLQFSIMTSPACEESLIQFSD
ncbi:hypothetical protein STEG23_012046 [Scotinomys teguina]